MDSSMFNFRNTVSTGAGQLVDGDPGDLMGLPDFLAQREEPINFDKITADPLDQTPGDILGQQIFHV
ncbi:MAG: hypothetical protein ABIH38_02170 [Patescibacteria group bacterium]